MQAQERQLEGACASLYIGFFEKFPNDNLRDLVSHALALLLKRQADLPGDPGGWAGGIVYAVASGGCGVPGVMNADFEEAFGTKMATIRKRAEQVRQVLTDDAPLLVQGIAAPQEFTLRDEANAICAYAFRNGPIEDIHADGRISDGEMKHLMVRSCESMVKLLAMKQGTPAEYAAFIRDYGRKYCGRWER